VGCLESVPKVYLFGVVFWKNGTILLGETSLFLGEKRKNEYKMSTKWVHFAV
jgi:hypothetical protein